MNSKRATVATATLAAAILSAIEATPSSALSPMIVEAKAYSIAKTKQGDPYQYGAAGPYRFDCSGLTYYAFRRAGWSMPRTAQSQYNNVNHISWHYRRTGDLVFIGYSSRSISHVGIYAGYWSGRSWMINANSGHYRGYKVVTAPINEYLGGGRHAYYGRLK